MEKSIKIKEIAITTENMIELVNKDNVYCVVSSHWSNEKYVLKPFGEVEIKNVLSGNIPVIEIVSEQGLGSILFYFFA